MKLRCTRGFGLIEGPDGEQIDVQEPFEVDGEVGAYLQENYPGIEVVEADDIDETPTPEAEETTFECGVNGCSRTVDKPDDSCWQH